MVKLTESLVLARSRASDLENVRKLNCWGTDLTNISILRRMTCVTIVSLSVNKIETLADFAYCKNLEELYIRKNHISNLREICHLQKLAKLRILWLADNPCAVGDRYRLTVLKALPNLQKLDNVTVTEDEVNEALEGGLDLISLTLADNGGSSGEPLVVSVEPTSEVSTASDGSGASAVGGGDVQPQPDASSSSAGLCEEKNAVEMSWEETNKIRQQLGLKPLPVEKVSQLKPRLPPSNAKARNANILQAALCLIKELDAENLEIVADAVRNRLEIL